MAFRWQRNLTWKPLVVPWLVVEPWYTYPSDKWFGVSWDDYSIPNQMESHKHVPNHQAVPHGSHMITACLLILLDEPWWSYQLSSWTQNVSPEKMWPGVDGQMGKKWETMGTYGKRTKFLCLSKVLRDKPLGVTWIEGLWKYCPSPTNTMDPCWWPMSSTTSSPHERIVIGVGVINHTYSCTQT